MLPEARIGHRLPHRVRVRIDSRRGDERYFERLEKDLSDRFNYETVQTCVTIGSLLLADPALDVEAVSDFARQNDLFDLRLAPAGAAPVAVSVAGPIGSVSRTLNRITGGAIDLPGLVFLSLLSFGIVDLIRGNFRTPPWYTALWYSFGVFSKSIIDRKNPEAINGP
mgnify:CR=1 FL=1